MLPIGNFTNLYFPMTADVYYSSQEQNEMGEFSKSWSKDRSIYCSASKNINKILQPALSSEKFLEYDIKINFRTNENIYKSQDGTIYRVTDIMVKNIKDPFGSIVWAESESDPTSFEVENIQPLYDEMHNSMGYRILLKRSSLQVS